MQGECNSRMVNTIKLKNMHEILIMLVPLMYNEIINRRNSPFYYKKYNKMRIEGYMTDFYRWYGIILRWIIVLQTILFVIIKYFDTRTISFKEATLYIIFGWFIGIVIERCFNLPKWVNRKPYQSYGQIISYIFCCNYNSSIK